MKRLDEDSNVEWWQSEELYLRYPNPLKKGDYRRYFPDMIVKFTDGSTVMIEIKPDSQTRPPKMKPADKKTSKRYLREVTTYLVNEAKWNAAEKYCEARGWQFKIVTDKDIKPIRSKLK